MLSNHSFDVTAAAAAYPPGRSVDPAHMSVDLLRRNERGRWELYPAGDSGTLVLWSAWQSSCVSRGDFADVFVVPAERFIAQKARPSPIAGVAP
jgi:hypothetical protein